MANPRVETIASHIRPASPTLDATDTIRVARRRMEANNVRSLPVVRGERYVGIISWQVVRRLSGKQLDDPVQNHTLTDIPTLSPTSTIADAMAAFHRTEVTAHGLLPIVDAFGGLKGQIEREEFQGLMEDGTGRITVPKDPVAHLLSGPNMPEVGAKVVSSDGRKLGSFQRHVEDRGRPRWIAVQHGFLWKKRDRRVPLVAIARQTPAEIVLAIDAATWATFADDPRRG